MRPGDSWQQSCRGVSEGAGTNISAGPNTYIGRETVDVGGVEEPAYHLRSKRTFQGSQTGTEQDDLWVAVDTGLPLRSEWTEVVHSSSPIGTVTYTEDGRWTLDGLKPRKG
jgi:hypothetical protein